MNNFPQRKKYTSYSIRILFLSFLLSACSPFGSKDTTATAEASRYQNSREIVSTRTAVHTSILPSLTISPTITASNVLSSTLQDSDALNGSTVITPGIDSTGLNTKQSVLNTSSSNISLRIFMTGIFLGALLMGGGLYVIQRRRGQMAAALPRSSAYQGQSIPGRKDVIPLSELTPKVFDHEADVNAYTVDTYHKVATPGWNIFGASVIGSSHVKHNKPCQDTFATAKLVDDGSWGIAVISDGMGSARHAEIGSRFVAKTSIKEFMYLVQKNDWLKMQKLPLYQEWKTAAEQTFVAIRRSMNSFAANENYHLNDLKCTVIVIIYSPYGILSTHIGDGRAAYQDNDNRWHAMMIPYKGEEANSTCSITDPRLIIESRLIDTSVKSFVLMSDGCEKSAFRCSVFNEDSQKWFDPNEPYTPFLVPLVQDVVDEFNHQYSMNDIVHKIEKILISGTKQLQEETDDKTIIIGVMI
jgi:hypothetical protein